MNPQTGTTETKSRKARGRKDSQGQEGVINRNEVEESLDELTQLYAASASAAEELNDAIKAVAERSGLLASVVRKYVTAKAGEKFDDVKKTVEQLSLIFDV